MLVRIFDRSRNDVTTTSTALTTMLMTTKTATTTALTTMLMTTKTTTTTATTMMMMTTSFQEDVFSQKNVASSVDHETLTIYHRQLNPQLLHFLSSTTSLGGCVADCLTIPRSNLNLRLMFFLQSIIFLSAQATN